MCKYPDLSLFFDLANTIKKSALPHFRKPLIIENKEVIGFDPVTKADKETEEAIRQMLMLSRPDDGILGEEQADYHCEREHIWIIDPIDGTRAFISGLPTWGSLVGLTYKGKAIAGMMFQPFTSELYYTCGKGSYLNYGNDKSSAIKTSCTKRIEDAVLFSTAPELFKGNDKKAFSNVSNRAKLTRYGTDCYAFAMLASGFVDLVIETGLKPYDIAALIPIIEQAGGIVTQWNGGRAEEAGNIIAAANPEIYEKAVHLLNE